MYAIVRIGGKQYHAEVGRTIVTERLPHEVGDKLEFKEVLLVSDGERALIGQPLVEGSVVRAEVVAQFKGKKIIVFKYRPKQRYRRKMGHRQWYTRLLVSDIIAPDADTSTSTKRSRSKKSAETSPEA